MQRINGRNWVYIDGKKSFTDTPQGTQITADWCNTVQEEICNVISSQQIALDATNDAQLLQAIRALIKDYQNVVYMADHDDEFHTTMASIGPNQTTTIIIDDAVTMQTDITVPSYVSLWFIGEGNIDTNGYTLTVNGPIIAAPRLIFTNTTGTITLNGQEAYVDWWGTDQDAFDDLFSSGSVNAKLKPGGEYTITSLTQITINGGSLTGPGKFNYPKITYTANAGTIIDINANRFQMSGFELYGPGTGGTEIAIKIQGPGCKVSDVTIRNVHIGIQDETYACIYENMYIDTCETGIYFASGDDANLRSSYITPGSTGGSYTGVRVYQKNTLTLTGVHLDTFDLGISVRADGANTNHYCRSCNIIGCFWEGIENVAGRAIHSTAGGASVAGGYRNTRFNVLGGHIDTDTATNYDKFIQLGLRDNLYIAGLSVAWPELDGGGTHVNFIDDAAATSGRVSLSNMYIYNPATVLSNSNAAMLDLTTMDIDNYGKATMKGSEGRVALAYSAAMTPNLNNGDYFYIDASDAVNFTINNATNGTDGQEFTIMIYNNPGVAGLGAITWGANYLFDAGVALAGGVAIAEGHYSQITFRVENSGADFIEKCRSEDIA